MNEDSFSSYWWFNWLPLIIPVSIAILIFMCYFLIKRIKNRYKNGSFFNLHGSSIDSISLSEIGGYDEIKEDIMDFIEFIRNPGKFISIGAKIPKGALFIGPPGTGKTLMAKAIAKEAGVPFISIVASEFVELFVGVGAVRIRQLFSQARSNSPCIIFIDEIDAIGRCRDKSLYNLNDERESALNQLLAELDGINPGGCVIVFAATNRLDILDPALIRPGRFDRHIHFNLPGKKEREEIFNQHLKGLRHENNLLTEYLLVETQGMSGAEIATACNEAAILAVRNNNQSIKREDLQIAIEKILAGTENKRIITPGEKKIIATYEIGNMIVRCRLKQECPAVISMLYQAGQKQNIENMVSDKKIVTQREYEDILCMALSGQAAEELVFNRLSSRGSDQLECVTKIAYSMILKFGFNSSLGHVNYINSENIHWNGFQKPYSEHTAAVIDREVQLVIKNSYERAKTILKKYKEKIGILTSILIERESISREEIEKVLGS